MQTIFRTAAAALALSAASCFPVPTTKEDAANVPTQFLISFYQNDSSNKIVESELKRRHGLNQSELKDIACDNVYIGTSETVAMLLLKRDFPEIHVITSIGRYGVHKQICCRNIGDRFTSCYVYTQNGKVTSIQY